MQRAYPNVILAVEPDEKLFGTYVACMQHTVCSILSSMVSLGHGGVVRGTLASRLSDLGLAP